MSIQPVCDRCHEPLTEFGGLAFGPPRQSMVLKLHICADCWPLFLAWVGVQLGAALVEPAGEPPRPLEHTPFAMPDGAERCAADGLPWPCPAVGDPQPPTCATCNGTGLVCTLATWPYRSVPCPSAAPPDPRCKCGPFTYAGPEPYPATVTCARCGQIVNLRPPDHTCRPDYQNGVCLDCGEPSAYPDPAP